QQHEVQSATLLPSDASSPVAELTGRVGSKFKRKKISLDGPLNTVNAQGAGVQRFELSGRAVHNTGSPSYSAGDITDRPSPTISDAAVAKVAASIQEFGWRQPIVVDANRVIVAGHTRLLAARKLGLKEVPVHVADNLTPAQIKAYRLMDNRSHDETSWDFALL